MGDVNIEGQVAYLGMLLDAEPWKETWHWLNLGIFTFADLGLDRTAADSVVWHTCQNESIALVTDNRNATGSDSLEATIRLHNTTSSLPVFTLANTTRFNSSQSYAQEVAEKLLEYLLSLDQFLGAGRLYLP